MDKGENMLNIAVVNIKDLIKYLVSVVIIVIVIFGLTRFFNEKKEEEEIALSVEKVKEETEHSMKEPYYFCLDSTIPGIKAVHEKNKQIAQDEAIIEKEKSPLLKMLTLGLAMTEQVTEAENTAIEESAEETPTQEEEPVQESEEETTVVQEAQTGLPTEVVTENNTANNKYTMTCYGVNIKNESDNTITEDMLDLNIEVNKNKVLLFHTHTCESYTPSPGYEYQASRNISYH